MSGIKLVSVFWILFLMRKMSEVVGSSDEVGILSTLAKLPEKLAAHVNYFDKINVESRLGDTVFVESQIKCLIYDGPCDSFGRRARAILPSVILDNCRLCTNVQKSKLSRVVVYLQQKYPGVWRDALIKYGGAPKFITAGHVAPQTSLFGLIPPNNHGTKQSTNYHTHHSTNHNTYSNQKAQQPADHLHDSTNFNNHQSAIQNNHNNYNNHQQSAVHMQDSTNHKNHQSADSREGRNIFVPTEYLVAQILPTTTMSEIEKNIFIPAVESPSPVVTEPTRSPIGAHFASSVQPPSTQMLFSTSAELRPTTIHPELFGDN